MLFFILLLIIKIALYLYKSKNTPNNNLILDDKIEKLLRLVELNENKINKINEFNIYNEHNIYHSNNNNNSNNEFNNYPEINNIENNLEAAILPENKEVFNDKSNKIYKNKINENEMTLEDNKINNKNKYSNRINEDYITNHF